MAQYTNGPDLFPLNLADLRIMVGSRFRMLIQVTCDWQTDFTGWTASMQVRPSRTDDAELLADLSAYVSVSAGGQVAIDIDADAAEIISAAWDTGEYDVDISPSDASEALRVMQGRLTLNKEVAR